MEAPDVDTYLWRSTDYVLGRYFKTFNYRKKPQFQKRGTCAGQSTKTAVEDLIAQSCAIFGYTFPGRIAVSGIYPGARVEIGRNPSSNANDPYQDGAVVEYCMRMIHQYGLLLLKNIPLPEDATDEDEQLAVKWCASRDGVPANYETRMKDLFIDDFYQINNAREAAKAIQNFNTIVCGSNLIPPPQRDNNGYLHVKPAGGHAITFRAVRYNPFGLLYQQSWGPWGTGKSFPDDMPEGSGWIDEDEANAMIAQKQTFAIVRPNGLSYNKKTMQSNPVIMN